MRIDREDTSGWARIYRFSDEQFDAHVAIHTQHKGGKPSIGGCRIRNYNSRIDAGLDAMRLSATMTDKLALAGLKEFGGAKMVVNGSLTEKSMEQIAEVINFFDGDFITGTDLGFSLEDALLVGRMTPYIEKGKFGDTAIHTARGVFSCIRELDLWLDKRNINIFVQGAGAVGMEVIRLLAEEGWYNIYVTDLKEERVREAKTDYGAKSYDRNAHIDVFVPCAVGNVVTMANLHTFHDSVICGAANNQLENDYLAKLLLDWDCWYCPDFLVNAGGVIACVAEIEGWSENRLDRYIQQRSILLRSLLGITDQLNVDMMSMAKCLVRETLS